MSQNNLIRNYNYKAEPTKQQTAEPDVPSVGMEICIRPDGTIHSSIVMYEEPSNIELSAQAAIALADRMKKLAGIWQQVESIWLDDIQKKPAMKSEM